MPLFCIALFHPINRETAFKKTEERTRAIASCKQELLRQGVITMDFLKEITPSAHLVKVVRAGGDACIVFEGNGRIAAFQKVFTPQDNMKIEVELYELNDPDILVQIQQLRARYEWP